jgi:hypothetical protein
LVGTLLRQDPSPSKDAGARPPALQQHGFLDLTNALGNQVREFGSVEVLEPARSPERQADRLGHGAIVTEEVLRNRPTDDVFPRP